MSRASLAWFVRLRWLFLSAAVLMIVLERVTIGDARRPLGLLVTISALAVVNLWWAWCARRLRPTPNKGEDPIRARRLAIEQVAVDLLALTVILRYTGGVESPLISFYLFHMAISALLLPTRVAIAQGVWAIVLAAGLALGEQGGLITPHYAFLPGLDPVAPLPSARLTLAVLVVHVVSVSAMLYFTLQLAHRLHMHEAVLLAANEDLRRQARHIAQLQRQRSRFMQTAAHQLKGPLAAIQTLAGLVHEQCPRRSTGRDLCDRIIARSNAGIAQVGELLTLARVQDRAPGGAIAPVEVAPLIEKIVTDLRAVSDAKRLSVTVRRPREAVFVAASSVDVRDCLQNLVENAIKYTPERGRVSVALAVEDATMVFTVRDTGIGFDPDALQSAHREDPYPVVFEPFRRGNNALSRGIPGTGLGLAIVHAVVQGLGGGIVIESAPGEGATVTVRLPTCDPPTSRTSQSTDLQRDLPATGVDVALRRKEPEHAGSDSHAQ